MSLKTFLSKLWKSVKSLFESLVPEVKKSIHIGVVVVEAMKNFVESPGVDVFTAITKNVYDDKAKDLLRLHLPKLLISLKLAENCANETDPAKIVACAIKTLQSVDESVNSAFLHSLSIIIAQVASDGKLTWSDGATVLEWYYQNHKKAA